MDLTQQIFNELQEIRKAAQETKEDVVAVKTILIPTPGQPSVIDNLKSDQKELEDRISSLENLKWWAAGAFAIISTVWEFIAHNFASMFHKGSPIK